MRRVEWGVRLTDVRTDWHLEVPHSSLDRAEEVVNWHNDPRYESCYVAELIQREIDISEWHPIETRNVAI